MNKPIRVLIADDHRLFREGLRQICELVGGFIVVGEAENGQAAIDLACTLDPDVILMDINMPVLDGVQATQKIAECHPQSRVMILTMYRQDHYVFQAIKAGARGYLLKDTNGRDLVAAVERVHRGEALIDPGLAAQVLDEFRRISLPVPEAQDAARLTVGEMQVLQLVAQGDDNKTIADQLNIAERTVANRLRDIFQKLHVNNRTQAALVALRKGWAKLEEE
jgi:two-component system, NarL family, response regulator LiaR